MATTILAGLAGGMVVIGLVVWTIVRASRWDEECETQTRLKNGRREADKEAIREIEPWSKGK